MILDWEIGGSFPELILEFPVEDSEYVREEILDAVAVRIGPPGANGAAGSIFRVDFASLSVWTLNHNLNREIQYQLYTSAGIQLMAEALKVSADQMTFTFDVPVAGFVVYR